MIVLQKNEHRACKMKKFLRIWLMHLHKSFFFTTFAPQNVVCVCMSVCAYMRKGRREKKERQYIYVERTSNTQLYRRVPHLPGRRQGAGCSGVLQGRDHLGYPGSNG